MATNSDIDYFQQREATCRALAARAANQTIADIHSEMAARYAELVSQCSTPRLRLISENGRQPAAI